MKFLQTLSDVLNNSKERGDALRRGTKVCVTCERISVSDGPEEDVAHQGIEEDEQEHPIMIKNSRAFIASSKSE